MRTIANHDVKIFTDNVEATAIAQIERLVSVPVFMGSKIRIMPDVHAGAGCVIGFTGNLGERVIPNVVGVDIGCGMHLVRFKNKGTIDFHRFHCYIMDNVPSGKMIRDLDATPLVGIGMEIYRQAKELVMKLRCYRNLKFSGRINKSIGTLGGGNHFIELDVAENGDFCLVVHTGSRNLGKQVAEYYQKVAVKYHMGWNEVVEKQKQIIKEYKASGRRSEIEGAIKELHRNFKAVKLAIPDDLCYLEGQDREDYLHDMRLCQQWATLNRKLIVFMLMKFFGEVEIVEEFETIHNYISDDNIIRKGAVSAAKGEKCIIPLNMRDGSLICTGKGNEDWNCSAPHGAGRVLSRGVAIETLKMEDFKTAMGGIYSECVVESTIDESPMVYKPAQEIIEKIGQTVAIDNIIKPIFNFKAK